MEGAKPLLEHTIWSERQKVKNLNPSQMFFWKPSEDDLSNRNVRKLPAKKNKGELS